MAKNIQNKAAFAVTFLFIIFISSLGNLHGFDWQEFHSSEGKCKIAFPEIPQHVKENLSIPETDLSVQYDAYISADSPEAVFLMLVAQYPMEIERNRIEMGLEGFLSGIVNHSPDNNLLFADLVQIEGHQGMEFFIQNGPLFFKGRALIVKNRLYLMVMEAEGTSYKEEIYNYFVNSFKFSK